MKPFLSLILLLALVGCSSEQASWPTRKFVAEDWAATAETERYVFARDLVGSKMLVGKTAAQVKQLLGTPSAERQSDGNLSYVIKTGGSGFDQVYAIQVNVNSASGIVESATIRGD